MELKEEPTEHLETLQSEAPAAPTAEVTGEVTAEVTGEVTGEVSGEVTGEVTLDTPDYAALAMRLAQGAAQVVRSGDQLVAVVVNPAWAEGIQAAFRDLPENLVPEQIRAGLPFDPDPECPSMQLITRLDLEIQFLTQYYGPREQGGNGFLQELDQYLERNQCPVRPTPEFLRTKFLLETSERFQPRILTPGSQPLVLPQGLGRR